MDSELKPQIESEERALNSLVAFRHGDKPFAFLFCYCIIPNIELGWNPPIKHWLGRQPLEENL